MVNDNGNGIINLDGMGRQLARIFSSIYSQKMEVDDNKPDQYAVEDIYILSDVELNNFFRTDYIVQKVIRKYPKKAKNLGYILKDKNGNIINTNDEFILESFCEASIFSRLYGKVYMIYDTGDGFRTPLTNTLLLIGYKLEYDLEIKGDFYIKSSDKDIKYHNSRVFLFIGYRTYIKDVLEDSPYYSDSVLQPIFKAIKNYLNSVDIAKHILANISYLTMGIDNLATSTKTTEGRESIYERLLSINLNRDATKILAYDKGKEDVGFISQGGGGFGDLMEEIKNLFVSESDYTYSDLFEETPRQNIGSGIANQLIARMLSAERLKDWVEENWLKQYTKIFRILYGDEITIEIPYKVELTVLEQAELENLGATRIKTLIDAGVISTEEGRTGYQGAKYSLNIDLSEFKPQESISEVQAKEQSNNTDSNRDAEDKVTDQFWEDLAKVTKDDLNSVAKEVLEKKKLNKDIEEIEEGFFLSIEDFQGFKDTFNSDSNYGFFIPIEEFQDIKNISDYETFFISIEEFQNVV